MPTEQRVHCEGCSREIVQGSLHYACPGLPAPAEEVGLRERVELYEALRMAAGRFRQQTSAKNARILDEALDALARTGAQE